MAEFMVVGSGAAGVAAALALVRRGVRPLLLDAGFVNEAVAPRVYGNLYDYRRRRDSFDLHIGPELSGLASALSDEPGVAKLNAPNMAFVTRDAERLAPLEQIRFRAVQSFAAGGLGNAWGAGLYRWVESDLDDFPVALSQLEPYFDILTREIGISGQDDDLTSFFGNPAGLLPPLTLSHNARLAHTAYLRQREAWRRAGLHLGFPRVAALSVPYDGRPACDYGNLEFWQAQPFIYTPAVTLQKLVRDGRIDYRPGVLVHSWEEGSAGIAVRAASIDTGAPIQFSADTLLLAAGAINTARIALQSRGDLSTRLPLLENPIVQIPLITPRSVGRRLDTDTFGLVQLNIVWQQAARGILLQGSLIELTAPMRSEFFGRFPLSARGNLAAMRALLPAMMMLQLYYPGSAQPPAELSLSANGRLRIAAPPHDLDRSELAPLLAALRKLGLWTHPALIQQPPTGHAIHYAGTLPMRHQPGDYQCHPDGRLHGAQRVFVADSASFPTLPAKNMSFGMMANAMRIATLAAT
ncbi:MAG: GMC oxidoreductase [Caldilineales bacterium]